MTPLRAAVGPPGSPVPLRSPLGACALLALALVTPAHSQQRNDSTFDVRIAAPAHVTRHPRLLIDAAHNNVFSTSTNRIEPLAQMLRADGFVLDTTGSPFTRESLTGSDLLVVLTATGQAAQFAVAPAFTPAEIDAVYDWVTGGGALLFCLDHYPFASSGRQLAERFGVEVFLGYVADSVGFDRAHGDSRTPVYSRSNGGLSSGHAIIRGRNPQERLERVAVFGGLSLTGPAGSSVLLRVASSAVNLGDRGQPGEGLGEAQAIALEPGRGRVVITADCTMWTSQVSVVQGTQVRLGMARQDLDNRQFALNVARWLSRAID
jgi:hypothetical protein